MAILPKAIYRFNAIPIKTPKIFYADMEKQILRFIWNYLQTRISKTALKKNNKAEELKLPISKLAVKLQ